MQFEHSCDSKNKRKHLKSPKNPYIDYSTLLDCTFCGKEFKQNKHKYKQSYLINSCSLNVTVMVKEKKMYKLMQFECS